MDATNGVIHDSKPTARVRTPQSGAALGALPADCRRILIVGAGGFGREVLQWAREAWPDSEERIGGFLAAERFAAEGRKLPIPIIGDPDDFTPAAGDLFLLAIGIPLVRRRVAEVLAARGGRFTTLIHPSSIVAPTASVDIGSILCPYTIVSDNATVGPFTLLNYFSSLGHDAQTGRYCVLSPYATLGGGAHLEDDVFMGMHASVGPARRIGSRSKISANSCALTDSSDDSLIYGSPGRVSSLISVGRS